MIGYISPDFTMTIFWYYYAFCLVLLGYDLYWGARTGQKVATTKQVAINFLIFFGTFYLLNSLHDYVRLPLESFFKKYQLIEGGLPHNWVTLLFAIVLLDFTYYAYHRLHHSWSLFWIPHATHHSDPDFNLSTGARLSVLNLGVIYRSPIMLLGIPEDIYFFAYVITVIYPTWLHSRAFPKIPFVEWFVYTPSGHRVHHSNRPEEMNCNFGGIFTIFDRLGGTYRPETHPIDYNIPGFSTHNFIEMQTVGLKQYLRKFKKKKPDQKRKSVA